MRLRVLYALFVAAPLGVGSSWPAEPPAARQLIGLWSAYRHFGPRVRGPITIRQQATAWTAEIAGRTETVKVDKDRLSFSLPGQQGSFRGRVLQDGRISGHWTQPRTTAYGSAFATPVVLDRLAPGRWAGAVVPLEDEMTFHMRVFMGGPHGSGKVSAFLRNPQRNAARSLEVEELVLDGSAVKVMGRRAKDAPAGELLSGHYNAEDRTLSLYIPWAGGTFDFRRATHSDEAAFHPHARTPAPWVYVPPPEGPDGWPVGTLQGAGLSREAIAAFVNKLAAVPIDDVHALDVHGLLVARHGKLVLEEYFHGFHRDALHDTRSAGKSFTSALVGAAMSKGAPLRLDTRVYEAMNGGTVPAGLDERARALTLEHLLTMSSGLDCDDADPASPGNEDTMQEQEGQPDWYRFTLDLKMVRAPGEKAVYCSVNPNLAAGVLARSTARPLAELFDELIARPLQLGPYALNLMPRGEPYMGGGARLLPRDFLKLAQVMMDGGRWQGRAVVSPEWARASTSPLRDLNEMKYGYLWWSTEYPYKDRKVRAFFAAGNGGQIAMAVPELELAVAFYGGNYNDPMGKMAQGVFVPSYILPAVN